MKKSVQKYNKQISYDINKGEMILLCHFDVLLFLFFDWSFTSTIDSLIGFNCLVSASLFAILNWVATNNW